MEKKRGKWKLPYRHCARSPAPEQHLINLLKIRGLPWDGEAEYQCMCVCLYWCVRQCVSRFWWHTKLLRDVGTEAKEWLYRGSALWSWQAVHLLWSPGHLEENESKGEWDSQLNYDALELNKKMFHFISAENFVAFMFVHTICEFITLIKYN